MTAKHQTDTRDFICILAVTTSKSWQSILCYLVTLVFIFLINLMFSVFIIFDHFRLNHTRYTC